MGESVDAKLKSWMAEIQPFAEVVKLVDTLDSKSSGGDPVPVRFRLSAPVLSDQSENSSAGRAQPCQG